MPRPIQNTISPIAPEILAKVHMPLIQTGTRIACAILALAYAYFVPHVLLLTYFSWFTLGVVIYVALQGILGIVHSFYGASPVTQYLVSLLDLAGYLCLLINDPATLPPTLVFLPGMLMLTALIQPLNSFLVFYGAALLATALEMGARAVFLGIPTTFQVVSVSALLLAVSGVVVLVTLNLDKLRLRSALVTEADELTGLGNRWTFYEAAKYLIPYHQRNLTPMVIMYAEVEIAANHRKQLSRPVVDLVVKQFASIIDQRVRASDIAVRYDRAAFALLMADTSSKDAEAIAFDLQQSFNQWAKQKDFPAYAHIGLAVVPIRPIALDQILININAALFRAKQYKKGVSGAVFADPEQG